jgi:hypothetical protein
MLSKLDGSAIGSSVAAGIVGVDDVADGSVAVLCEDRTLKGPFSRYRLIESAQYQKKSNHGFLVVPSLF